MRRIILIILNIVWLTSLVIFLGCSEDVYISKMSENKQPIVRLTNGPLEGDTTEYYIHFYWIGYDLDGTVKYYEYIMVEGNPIGFDPDDTTGIDKWTSIFRRDITLKVSADEYTRKVKIDNNLYSKYSKTHTFFIRAIDDRGMRSKVAYRSFTAYTLAPFAIIESPKNPHPGQHQTLNALITFRWTGKDPIDTPWNYKDIDSVRYFCMESENFDVLDELNKNPENFETRWSPWIWYHEPGDSGKQTIIGDDEILPFGIKHVFVVQAMDEAGAVSSIFDALTNARVFTPIKNPGPKLEVRAPYIGSFIFLGQINPYAQVDIISGFPLIFYWEGDASHYGGTISSYRYGWDIEELDDPLEWDVFPSPSHKSTGEKIFQFGTHTLYIEATDNFGVTTLAQIEINVLQMAMNRNLLWIDDFPSSDFHPQIYAMPQESEHDQFWINICDRAQGFDSDCDVYDVQDHHFIPPSIELIFKYKNIIWTYSSTPRMCEWYNVIKFSSEEIVGGMPTTLNYILLFLQAGGHIWSLGKSDRAGGLAGVLQTKMFPLNLKCEIFGLSKGCSDTTGVLSVAYRDYCVSVLDKVLGNFRPDPMMPQRSTEKDALSSCYSDLYDPLTLENPELPDSLKLWDMVTQPGMFFDPMIQGFTYVEAYNPEYWMTRNLISTQSCFHPMYRMKARYSRTALDNAVIAFWTTKYANVTAKSAGSVAAPSVHFGIPLWFFNREHVDAIADVIFDVWQIKEE